MRVKVALVGQKTQEVTLEGTSATVTQVLQAAKITVKNGKDGRDQVLVNGEAVTDLNTRVADNGVVSVVPNIKGGKS